MDNLRWHICGTMFFITGTVFSRDIVVRRASAGLFSNLSEVRNVLRQTEQEQVNVSVVWGAESPYYQKEGYHGFSNVFEYYFYPIPARITPPVYDSPLVPPYIADPLRLLRQYDYRWQSHELISRYIHLRPYIQQRIDNFYNTHMKGKKIIGVHLRSKSKDVELVPVPLQKIFTELQEYKDYMFYVASDAHDYLAAMYREFPGRCISLDIDRGSSDKSLLQKTPTKWAVIRSPAQAGDDAIVDTYLLSKCEKIIMTHYNSNVVMYALLLNLDLEPICLQP